MKKFPGALLFMIMSIAIVFTACNQAGLSSQMLGKWKIDEMHIQYYMQQQEYGEKQMQSLMDSAAKSTDTAKIKTFNSQIDQIKNQLQAFQASRDSALKKNTWEFQEGGNFIATENDGPRKGLWSYDDKLGMLFTVIENQTSSVKVKFNKDTMVLQLDSVNYMKFTPLK
ncbi:MAG: hypothetical protein IPO83_01730 [Chitinophagaceae bacterium]|nr:hypothetical protein [Chitinophagaceae bacterium]